MNADASTASDSESSLGRGASEAPRTHGAAGYGYLAVMLIVGVASGWFAWHAPSSMKVMLILLAAWHGVRRVLALTAYVTADEGPAEFGSRFLESLVCIFWFGAAIILCAHRMDLVLFAAYGAGAPLVPAMWIQGCQLLWGMAMAATTALFLIHYLWRRMQGYGEGAGRLLLLATSIGMWWYAMWVVANILLGLLLFEVFQLLQGLAVAWRSSTTERPADEGVPVLFRHSVFWIVVYLAVFSAYGILLAMGRIPAEGVVMQDTVARVAAMLVAAALAVHFLSDELLLNRLRRVAGDSRQQQAVAGVLLRSGPAVVWLGMFVLAGWLMATGRNTQNLNIDVYDNVVTAYPNSWRAHTGLALELANIGELPTAVKELTLATQLNPDAANLRIELGRMLLAVNQPQEAVEELQRAIDLNPAAAAAYTELGNALLAQGKVKEGLAYLQAAAERRPDDPVARIKLGLAYFGLRQWEDALSSFGEAIELDPEMAMAYNGRGNVYWNEGKLDAAMREYDEAIRIDPELVSAYRNRARVWLGTQDEQKAMDDLDAAIRLDGSNASDYVLRGDLHNSRGDFAKALQDFQKAAELDRQGMVPLERLVTLWSSCPDESHRNLELASQAARTMCQLTEWRMPAALQTLAVVLAAQGNYEEGLRWQTEAVKLAGEDAKESYQKQLETLKQLSEKADADKSGSGP